jgi:hypothetical protein
VFNIGRAIWNIVLRLLAETGLNYRFEHLQADDTI